MADVAVNPPPRLRIPDEFLKDPLTRAFFEQTRLILFQLWTRTGGPDDSINENEQSLTSTASRVARNAARINALELVEFEVIIITDDYTTVENEIVICKNVSPIIITLNPNAVEKEDVHIKRKNAQVIVVGMIDGHFNRTINIKNYSMHLIFDGTEWSEI